jgi:hypothetical protein
MNQSPPQMKNQQRGYLLIEALAGSVGPHQRFLLGAQLRHLADLDALIESLDAEIKERLRAAQDLIERLSTIPGVGGRTAEVILVEIGTDMARFGSSRQLAQVLFERLKLKPGGEITSDRLNRAVDDARKWLAKKDYLGARVTLHRGAYDAKTNTVPLDATFYAGSEVRLTVEGAKVSTRTLRKLVPIYEEGAVDEDLLQEGRRALTEWFQRAGYFDAKVSYTTSESPARQPAEMPRPVVRVVAYHVVRGSHHRLVEVQFERGGGVLRLCLLRDGPPQHLAAGGGLGSYRVP